MGMPKYGSILGVTRLDVLLTAIVIVIAVAVVSLGKYAIYTECRRLLPNATAAYCLAH